MLKSFLDSFEILNSVGHWGNLRISWVNDGKEGEREKKRGLLSISMGYWDERMEGGGRGRRGEGEKVTVYIHGVLG